MKNRLDEMQEQKLLKIEHTGCWLAFFGLLIAIFVQLFLYGRDFQNIAGEWFVFMCLAGYITISCMKNGIWDRTLAPVPKTNLKVSMIAGMISGILFFILKYHEYHALWGSVTAGIFIFLIAFAACLTGLSFLAYLHRKRVEKLESEEEETKVDN